MDVVHRAHTVTYNGDVVVVTVMSHPGHSRTHRRVACVDHHWGEHAVRADSDRKAVEGDDGEGRSVHRPNAHVYGLTPAIVAN